MSSLMAARAADVVAPGRRRPSRRTLAALGALAAAAALLAVATAAVGSAPTALGAALHACVAAATAALATAAWSSAARAPIAPRTAEDGATRANDLLVALHAVVQRLPAPLDPAEVLAAMRVELDALVPSTTVTILVHDPTADAWRTELAHGVRAAPGPLSTDDLPPAARLALASGAPRLATDVGTGAGAGPGSTSAAAVPLLSRGRAIGLALLERRDGDPFEPSDLAALADAAPRLALGLDNAAWFARLKMLGAESERARIARDLHDRLAQQLAYVGFELERLTGERDDPELITLREHVQDAVGELRDTLYELRAEVNERATLAHVARAALQRFQERTGIAVVFTARVRGRRIPFRTEQELWKIAQEALTNVERHADARRVWVTWMIAGRGAWLEVRDDGAGFDAASAGRGRFGLAGMRERADAVGARLTVESDPGSGTRVLVEVEVPQ